MYKKPYYDIIFEMRMNKQNSPKGASHANEAGSSPKMLIVASRIKNGTIP